MKIKLSIYIICITFLVACAHSSNSVPTGQLHRVTRDYAAVGDAAGIQPFVRGDNTLIKARRGKPLFGAILDDQGQPVSYTEQDGYYVLDRVLESFTVSADGRTVRFELLPTQNTEAESAGNSNASMQAEVLTAQDANVVAEAYAVKMNTPIFMLMKHQLIMQRALLNRVSENQKPTAGELFDIQSALDFTESKMAIEAAVVQAYFRFGSTAFKPSAEFTNVLLPAALEAKKVNLFGRTDSNIADAINTKIAHGRAQAVKNYLIKKGVSADKIEASSLAAGDFIGPSSTKAGRALNRRVTIEIIT
jgi:outer membrane protein OmpA-like peptidoglycan-associated protein